MKVLIIEDDAKIADFLKNGFSEAGFIVDAARDGVEGLRLARSHDYDVAVVDLMLPKLDGLSLIEKLRSDGVKTPIVILSARKSVSDRVAGLKTGSDDYLVKPFSFSELLARVEAVLRRAGNHQIQESLLRVGDLELDPWKREVRRGGKLIPLHFREFALLEFLMRNTGRVISKTAILENVYEYNFDPQTNVVDVLMHRLRKKVDGSSHDKLIQTVRGMGYVLKKQSD